MATPTRWCVGKAIASWSQRADAFQDNNEALDAALERGGASTFVLGIGGLDRQLSAATAQRPLNRTKKTGGITATTTATPSGAPSAVNSGMATPAGGEVAESGIAVSNDDAVAAVAASLLVATKTDNGASSDPSAIVDIKPAMLSGGQWQRIALSRAFLRHGETDLIVLDEPSASLGGC